MYNEGSFYLVLALTSSLGGKSFFILFIVRISDVRTDQISARDFASRVAKS